MEFGFIGPTYQSRSVNVNAQRCINLYPEIDESGSGKSRISLYGTPGLSALCTLPTGPVRCLWAGNDRLFAVAGPWLYEVYTDGSWSVRGAVLDDGNPAFIIPSGDGTHILIISNGLVWWDDGSTVQQAFFDEGEPVTARTGTFLNGYFIVNPPESGKFYLSALNNGASWSELDYATAEVYPDHVSAVLADHEELWLLGEQTCEAWRDEGDPDFPFRRDPGAAIPQGCIAPFSPCNLPAGPGWIGGDHRGQPIAWATQGFHPMRVSNHAVEQAWSKYSFIADARSYRYDEHGHTFWVITFPTADATWCYDFSTKMWHERQTGTSRHRGICHAFVFGRHFVGDHTTGAIYEMGTDIYTDAGADIARTRIAPHISEEELKIFYHRLQLAVETGEVTNPEFSLSWSNDGGHTWNTPVTINGGAIGKFKTRMLWRRLGSSRDRVFKITSTAPMRHAWINAYLRATGGVS